MTDSTTTTKIGLDGKVYASATTHESGDAITWAEQDLCESVEQEDSRAEAVIRNRKSEFARYGSGTRDVSYTLAQTYLAGDLTQKILLDAYANRSVIALAVMDGDITHVNQLGWYMDVEVFSAPKPETLDEFDTITFKVRPAAKSSFMPTMVKIAAA